MSVDFGFGPCRPWDFPRDLVVSDGEGGIGSTGRDERGRGILSTLLPELERRTVLRESLVGLKTWVNKEPGSPSVVHAGCV